MSATLNVTRDGAIGWIEFSNPARRNAIANSMWPQIGEAFAAFDRDPEIRVAIMRGAGDQAFVSGADINRFDAKGADPGAPRGEDAAAAWDAMDAFGKPLIAMVHGYCLGAGMAIAAKADLRIAAEGSSFGIPAGKLGLAYPPGLVRDLVVLVGAAKAKRMLFTADRFDAATALGMGLIDELVPAAALQDRVVALAGTIASNAPLALRAAKATIAHVTHGAYDDAIIRGHVAACSASADHAEGVRAFLEKRVPVFRGA